MAIVTQPEISQQLISQLRLLKPSISALVGTPERLILDTVAQSLADSQIDLVGLENALNLDSKFGSNLDAFLAIFGFSRQVATKAQGFVVFSRNVIANQDITIPQGTLLRCSVVTAEGINVEFTTTTSAVLPSGTLQTTPIPIAAVNTGSNGDVAAETITILSGDESGNPVLGVTAVTNPTATTGGQDQEDDNSLKVRFKNTVFRNLAGTKDQYLALAVATSFSKKANVVGPISTYQEYVQVPVSDDSTSYAYGGGASYPGNPPIIVTVGTVPSPGTTLVLPTTKGISAGMPIIVYSEGDNPVVAFSGTVSSIKSATELKLSGTPEVGGSPVTLTNVVVLIGSKETSPFENKWTTALSTIPYAKNIWSTVPVFISNGRLGLENFFFREGVDFEFNFPGRLQGDTLRAFIDGVGLDPQTSLLGSSQPNVTFTNVYLGSNDAVQAIGPSDVVLLEYSYTSTSSRNSLSHNITNAVDVFVDGGNTQPTTTIFTVPTAAAGLIFVDNPTSMFHYENYRRDGEPSKRPVIGNMLTPLYREPVTALPKQISIGENNYYLGTHYWLVHEVSDYAGTIRARDGIEWSAALGGDDTSLGEPTNPLASPPAYAGTFFNAFEPDTAVEIENYSFDQNIVDLQATLANSRQITTDVLAHKAVLRFFKFDITVVYNPTTNRSVVNNAIRVAASSFLGSQYFGSVIRLSDILQVIHAVPGVENVRWSNDVPNTSSAIRVYETDNDGRPLLGALADRIQVGTASQKEIQGLYVAGKPTGGSFVLKYGETSPITIPGSTFTAGSIQTAINAVVAKATTVTEDTRSTTGVKSPIRSFRISTNTNGAVVLPAIENKLVGEEYIFDTDFFLRDDELPTLPENLQPGDTVAGLIIRPRAENTWQRSA